MTAPLASIRGRARIVSVGLLFALAACSNSGGTAYTPYRPGEPPPPKVPTTGGGNGDFDAGTPSGTVMVQILNPMSGAMLSTNAAADVSAKVTIPDGNDLVDPATVRMVLTDAASGATLASAPLVGPVGISEFRGKLSLAGVKTGSYKITVTARSTTNVIGTATVDVGIDGGPLITVLSPIAGHSYKESLFVQVAINSAPFEPTMMDSIQSTIAGMPVDLKPTGQTNQFRAVFSLTMPTALEGEQIFVISAKNANGVRTEVRFVFFVDIRGPKFTQTAPLPGEIVGGVVKIKATIADMAGLNESSIQAIVGDKTTTQFKLALLPEGAGVYSVFFDTKLLTACGVGTAGALCNVRPVLSFRAADLLGNEANEAYTIAVDNMPPIADLDPPNIWVSKLDMGLRCSHGFDPLDHDFYSGDSPNDLCTVPQLFDLRARLEDDGNRGAGIKAVPISTVDPDRTAVYVLDATTLNGEAQALVVDTDGDGFCDDVNPKLETTTTPITNPRQALKIRMRPVPPGGEADFLTPDPDLPASCLPGNGKEIPEDLCAPGPQPSIAISYAGGLPAIWTIEPVLPPAGKGYCFGSQLDTFANNISAAKPPPGMPAAATGWKCIAVVATDMVGNRSTSAPLRVYLDDYKYGGSSNFCTNNSQLAGLPMPPSCTGTFDKATGIVSPKACKTRSFKLPPPGGKEICYKGDCG